MNRNKLVLFTLVLGVLVLSSCAGLPVGTGTGGGGGGTQNATLTLTMISQSQAKPSTYTLLAFNAQISSLTINESGGNSVPLVLAPAPYPVDFVRLSTDTALLGTFTVPPNILFSNATLALTNITITLHNESGGSIGTCPDNAICEFTPPPALATITGSPFSSAFTSGNAYNFYLNIIPDDIIVTSAAGLTLNFTQNTPVSSIQLPRPGAAANTLDTIQDFTGKVMSVSGSTVTITAGSGVELQATIGGTATLDDPRLLCPTATIAACVVAGAVVSIDGTISTSGVLTANEFDLLDTTLKDDIEGVIFSTGPGTFALVVTDKQDAGDLPTLTAANIGDVFVVNGTASASYIVDTKNLTTANPPIPINLFASAGDLLSGQQVRLHVTAATGSAAAADQTLTTDVVQLRFSRVTAQANNVAGTIFNIDDLGSTTESLYGTAASSFQVQTFSATTFDNTANGINGIAMAGANDASIRALYINNIFYAAAARHQ